MPLFINKNYWYRLIKLFLEWIGTPYAHFKMEKGEGADCALFIASCLKDMGILKEVRYKYYHRFWHRFESTEVILNHIVEYIRDNFNQSFYMEKEDKDVELIRGDILVFSLRSRVSNHISMYLGNDLMINSINGRGVCIMPLSSIYKNRLTNIFRIYNGT